MDTVAVWSLSAVLFCIHSSSLFSALLCICGSVWPPPFRPCLSHPLCPCHTADACVVEGASWNLPPPQLGIHTKTSFQSQTQNYLPIVIQHWAPWCYLLKNTKRRPNQAVAHFCEFSLFPCFFHCRILNERREILCLHMPRCCAFWHALGAVIWKHQPVTACLSKRLSHSKTHY